MSHRTELRWLSYPSRLLP